MEQPGTLGVSQPKKHAKGWVEECYMGFPLGHRQVIPKVEDSNNWRLRAKNKNKIVIVSGAGWLNVLDVTKP